MLSYFNSLSRRSNAHGSNNENQVLPLFEIRKPKQRVEGSTKNLGATNYFQIVIALGFVAFVGYELWQLMYESSPESNEYCSEEPALKCKELVQYPSTVFSHLCYDTFERCVDGIIEHDRCALATNMGWNARWLSSDMINSIAQSGVNVFWSPESEQWSEFTKAAKVRWRS